MKRYQKKAAAATYVAAAAVLMSMGSCTGRTMENMEPVGETVEVAVEEVNAVTMPDGIITDPIALKDSLIR